MGEPIEIEMLPAADADYEPDEQTAAPEPAAAGEPAGEGLVTEDQVRTFLQTGFSAAALVWNDPELAATEDELREVVGPLTRDVNRMPILAWLVEQGDRVSGWSGLGLMIFRRVYRRVLLARRAADGRDGTEGAAETAAAGAAGAAGRAAAGGNGLHRGSGPGAADAAGAGGGIH